MPAPTPHASAAESQSRFPAIHITYECVAQTRTRESETYSYELACSISYPATSAHLSLKITGLNTYRKAAAKEVPFTRHETGATTYVELLDGENLEVRIVEQDGSYAKAFYYAHGQELTELHARRIVSAIHRIDTDTQR